MRAGEDFGQLVASFEVRMEMSLLDTPSHWCLASKKRALLRATTTHYNYAVLLFFFCFFFLKLIVVFQEKIFFWCELQAGD